jgi:hypothetical protein
MSKAPTQKDVDKIHPAALKEYKRLLKNSGKSQLMFKISHEAMQFMLQYQMVKEDAEGEGFTMPELFEDTKITL